MRMSFADFLQTVPSFRDFESQELAVLEKSLVIGEYPDGHEFIGESTRCEEVYLIVEGEVIATHRRSKLRGAEVIERLGSGDMFGLIALVDHRPCWATYRAVGRVTAASLPANVFDLLYTANTSISYRFQGLIAQQLARDFRACTQGIRNAFAGVRKNRRRGRGGYRGEERRRSDRRKGDRRQD